MTAPGSRQGTPSSPRQATPSAQGGHKLSRLQLHGVAQRWKLAYGSTNSCGVRVQFDSDFGHHRGAFRTDQKAREIESGRIFEISHPCARYRHLTAQP